MKKTFSIVKKLRTIILIFVLMKVFSISSIYLSGINLINGIKDVNDDNHLYNSATRIKEMVFTNRNLLNNLSMISKDPDAINAALLNFKKIEEEVERTTNTPSSDKLKKIFSSIQNKITLFKNMEMDLFNKINNKMIKSEDELKAEVYVLLQLELELRDDLLVYQGEVKQHSDITFDDVYKNKHNPLIIYISLSMIFLCVILYLGLSATKNLKMSIDNFLKATKAVSQDNLNYQATILFNDEIGIMTEAFNLMIKNLKEEKVKNKDIVEEKSALESEILIRKHTEAALENANKELESFSYSVSHDLRTPLRAIDGFSQALLEDYSNKLDEIGKNYLRYVREASQKMSQLIDDILSLSRITRSELARKMVNISDIAQSVVGELRDAEPARIVEIIIQGNLIDNVDPHLMRIVLSNLLGNSWKFTSKTSSPSISFGTFMKDGKKIYFVRDNGAGFDMTYSKKLFGAFQRLHATTEFPGTGIGLATVSRIIHRHNGTIWAKGEVNKGATFYFTVG